jgi:hypothetical protein
MNPPLAATAKLVQAQDIEVGSLFYLVRVGRIRGICMRVKLRDIPLFVMLEGGARFCVDEIAPSHYAIPIDSGSLQFRVGNSQPDVPDSSNPGCLVISETGPCMAVRLNSFGGAHRIMLLSFSDGILQSDFPSTECAVEAWQLIHRAADGSETLIFDTAAKPA